MMMIMMRLTMMMMMTLSISQELSHCSVTNVFCLVKRSVIKLVSSFFEQLSKKQKGLDSL